MRTPHQLTRGKSFLLSKFKVQSSKSCFDSLSQFISSTRMRLIIIIAVCGVMLQAITAQQPAPSLSIDSPHDFSTLVIKPPEVKLNNLFIHFSSSNIPEDSEICVIISAFGTSQNKPEQCISSNSNHIALSGVSWHQPSSCMHYGLCPLMLCTHGMILLYTCFCISKQIKLDDSSRTESGLLCVSTHP